VIGFSDIDNFQTADQYNKRLGGETLPYREGQ